MRKQRQNIHEMTKEIMIRTSIEINRSPADVFAYIEQLEKHGEWQEMIISAHKEPSGRTQIGTRNTEMRRMPGGPREIVSEIIEYDPPRRIAGQGLNGPIRARVRITIEPIDNGKRSRVIQELELVGYGIGKLFTFLARRSARKQMPKDQARLKCILESPG